MNTETPQPARVVCEYIIGDMTARIEIEIPILDGFSVMHVLRILKLYGVGKEK